MIPPHELDRVGNLLLAQEWIFAKTMPQNPHWYTLRKKWQSDTDFASVVESMRQHGYTEYYHGRPYTMLNVNGMKYWTMGAPIPETILINRKPLSRLPSSYDPIAPCYDAAFTDEASIAENRAVMALCDDLSRKTVLDIGCGTGLLLDYHQPGQYTGIDPSHAMLSRLKAKHPGYAGSVLPCRLEEFVGKDFDFAACLFGAANYIAPAYIAAIPRLLRPGGRYVVMFYRPGYSPVVYDRTGHAVKHYAGVHADLPGEQTTLGNFVIVQGQV